MHKKWDIMFLKIYNYPNQTKRENLDVEDIRFP